jgi:hypothetical protein
MPQPQPQQAPQAQEQALWPGMPMPGMGVQPGVQAMGGVPGAAETGVKPGMSGGGYPMMPYPPPMLYGMFPSHPMGPQPFGMCPPPCVPFQPMPVQPLSNVAQSPPPKNESHLPSREEETIRSLPLPPKKKRKKVVNQEDFLLDNRQLTNPMFKDENGNPILVGSTANEVSFKPESSRKSVKRTLRG